MNWMKVMKSYKVTDQKKRNIKQQEQTGVMKQ